MSPPSSGYCLAAEMIGSRDFDASVTSLVRWAVKKASSTTYKAWECARRACHYLETMHRRFEDWRSITGIASLITTPLQ
jgi:hypothetical protein